MGNWDVDVVVGRGPACEDAVETFAMLFKTPRRSNPGNPNGK